MKVLNICAAVSVLVLLVAAPHTSAQETSNFDFTGFARTPSAVGEVLEMFSILTNNGIIPTPIALDFVSQQHTLIIRGTLAFEDASVQQFSPATIEIYSQSIAGGTEADYANPATFEDGDLILSGVFDGNLTRNKFLPELTNMVGNVDWTGGSRLGDLGSETTSAPLVAGTSTRVDIPAGYEENWDGFVGESSSVAVEDESWGRIKTLYGK